METVDYLKLSEQYASFLVAVGGVGITVLTLVLSFGPDTPQPTTVNLRSFLVAALVVATVTCFIGAHMMAETAAFIEHHKNAVPPTGDRLFFFASINIFIAIILVLFALMLLPKSSGRVHAASIAPISVGVFLLVTCGTVYWLILGAFHRMRVPQSEGAVWLPLIIASALGLVLYFLPVSKACLLWTAFAPSALSTVSTLVCFASIFKGGDAAYLHKARIQDIWFFSLAISVSYAALVVAGIKAMLGKEFADDESMAAT